MRYDAEDKYADIINPPHRISRNHPQMSMTGGAYMEIAGRIKKLIPHEKRLIMGYGTKIPLEDIVYEVLNPAQVRFAR